MEGHLSPLIPTNEITYSKQGKILLVIIAQVVQVRHCLFNVTHYYHRAYVVRAGPRTQPHAQPHVTINKIISRSTCPTIILGIQIGQYTYPSMLIQCLLDLVESIDSSRAQFIQCLLNLIDHSRFQLNIDRIVTSVIVVQQYHQTQRALPY